MHDLKIQSGWPIQHPYVVVGWAKMWIIVPLLFDSAQYGYASSVGHENACYQR